MNAQTAVFEQADYASRLIESYEASQRALPERWTIEYVASRLIEAFTILHKLPVRRGAPVEFGNGWPAIVRDFSDAVGSEPTREQLEWEWSKAHARVSPQEIARMEQALSWPLKYLRGQPKHSKALLAWALCKAPPGRSLNREIAKRGLARATFMRHRTVALGRIVVGLKKDGAEVS